MSTVNSNFYLCFQLKPSRSKYGFQFFFGLVISIILFQILSLGIWLVAVFLLLISAYFWHRQARIEQFEQLDVDLWSVKMTQDTVIQQVKIKKMVDHLFYIVIYFEDINALNKSSNIIIWHDQCDLKSWKMLKAHANLG